MKKIAKIIDVSDLDKLFQFLNATFEVAPGVYVLVKPGSIILEQIAIPPDTQNNRCSIYVKDKAGVAELYYINDKREERDLSGTASLPTYTVATKPAAGGIWTGRIIYVSDGGAGANFQGSTGAAWVNLG